MAQHHFDDIAHQYDTVFKPHIANHYVVRRISYIREVCPSGKVLDFGCGTGVMGGKLAELGYEAHGVEYSKNMLEKAKERNVQGKLLENGKIPHPDNTFDLTYSVAVFHHLETEENVRSAISEMVRVTKPGGKILVWDHNARNPYWPYLMKRLPQDHGDERLVPLQEILDGFHQTPIAAVKNSYYGWIPEFVPGFLMPVMRFGEWVLEHTPLIRQLSAHNVVLAQKS